MSKNNFDFDCFLKAMTDIGLFAFEAIGDLLLLSPWLNAVFYYWDPSTCNQIPLIDLVICGFLGIIIQIACYAWKLERKLSDKNKSKD